jgi:hypothetical protein
VFSLFFRTRRRAPALRPHRTRLGVERLEGRDVPSSLDVISLAAPLPDPTSTSDTSSVSAALAPAPQTDTSTTSSTTVVVTPAPAPLAPAPQAGNTISAQTTTLSLPGLTAPTVGDVSDLDSNWDYSVSGTVSDANPAALTVNVSVDGKAVGSSAVKTVLNADGTPTNTGTWSVTFGLPPCSTATSCTRYGSAVATSGKSTSPATPFMIEQTPVVSSTLSSP